jgi:NADH-quinone oxidoreductase subunit C
MASPQDIATFIADYFGSRIQQSIIHDKHPRIHIGSETWPELAGFLKTQPELAFDWLSCLSGMDYAADATMAIVVDVYSTVHRHRFAIKVFAPRTAAVFASVSHLWKTANWHEREAADLLGIVFTNHPNPQRILLADDWVGHPLRKDYIFPREVNGIPGTVEPDWQQRTDKSRM